jgi:hypothetical protein
MNQPGMASIFSQLSIVDPRMRRLANSAFSTPQAGQRLRPRQRSCRARTLAHANDNGCIQNDSLSDLGAGTLA